MREQAEELDDVERCRQARRKLERRYGTLAGLCAHLRQLEKRRARNIALGRRLLQTGTSRVKVRRTRAGRAVALVAIGVLALAAATAHAAATWTPTGSMGTEWRHTPRVQLPPAVARYSVS
jgi:hypothetical protein